MSRTAPSPHNKGFTLVELLVVISIIAILSAIGLTIYTGAQKSARIAKRISDLKAIQSALEIYYSVNKSYPNTNGAWRSECSGYTSENVIPGLVPTYMTAFPADPSMNIAAGTSCYKYQSDGVDYKLVDPILDPGMTSADSLSQRNLIDPTRDNGPGSAESCAVDGPGIEVTAWAIWSSGACSW